MNENLSGKKVICIMDFRINDAEFGKLMQIHKGDIFYKKRGKYRRTGNEVRLTNSTIWIEIPESELKQFFVPVGRW